MRVSPNPFSPKPGLLGGDWILDFKSEIEHGTFSHKLTQCMSIIQEQWLLTIYILKPTVDLV